MQGTVVDLNVDNFVPVLTTRYVDHPALEVLAGQRDPLNSQRTVSYFGSGSSCIPTAVAKTTRLLARPPLSLKRDAFMLTFRNLS